MMVTYKLIKNIMTNELVAVMRSDGWFIPCSPDNTDYQAYLKFLEDGGTPLPADEAQS